ncbi:MAG TPA: GntR family transcriptional regulator [Bacteroidales bacterium]|nr:GntR family transcriptional regulator [Bacteroidales bacterium]HRZ47875.1 GntR family transcriptional regulator [Bacteroidales bacterium]
MEFSKHKSIYMQIADYFFGNILLGKWKPGEKVPSVRQLAIDLEVNPNTVMRTYTLMQDKNIIVNQRGIGFYVTEEAPVKVKEIVKAQFLSDDLPEVFSTMEMLGMEIQELTTHFHQWKSTQIQEHHEKDQQ